MSCDGYQQIVGPDGGLMPSVGVGLAVKRSRRGWRLVWVLGERQWPAQEDARLYDCRLEALRASLELAEQKCAAFCDGAVCECHQ